MQYQQSDLIPEEVVYAGFWERLAAAFIDGILVGVVSSGLLYLLGENLVAPSPASRFINLAIAATYFGYFESSEKQATLGKQALRIKVVSTDKQRISFMNALGRYFGKILSTVILLIGFLMMLWDDKKQTLHDRLAGTLVIKG